MINSALVIFQLNIKRRAREIIVQYFNQYSKYKFPQVLLSARSHKRLATTTLLYLLELSLTR